ncbi:hypothetical protein H4R18_003144 [Coemansia javaensis]|uniref:Uncharacterized protein n=1 Tax=Coemansia javaensis TaxID=2761396 RepID=A0A9W8HD10_9FUNG|nr:hypothetical protein H4R18_003144 [Coemansia javaensis]
MIRRAACQGVRVRWLSSQPAAGRRTHWTRELDERLRRLVAERGRAWKSIAADLGIEGSPLKVRSRWEVLQPKKRDVWTGDEDRALVQAIAEYTQGSRALGEYGSWVSIARRLGTGRTPAQCQTRWTYTLLPRQGKVVPFTRFKGVRGWMWSDDEEARLRRVVDATVNVDDPPEAVARAASEEPWLLLGIGSSGCMGQQFWIYVASRVGTRTANQCKRKWHSLSDAKGPGRFTISDARRMAELVAVHGRKWEFLAREHFPGVRPLDIQLHYNRWRQLEERHGVSLLEIDPLSMLKDYDGRSALRPTGPDGHYDPNGPLVRAAAPPK